MIFAVDAYNIIVVMGVLSALLSLFSRSDEARSWSKSSCCCCCCCGWRRRNLVVVVFVVFVVVVVVVVVADVSQY